MKIHEYQAKEILKSYGVPVPRGGLAKSAQEAGSIAADLGGTVVVKAQIHAGGRGKGGGVKLAQDAEEARSHASDILGMDLITHQTGPEGQKVKQVWIEEGTDIQRELYLGIVLDRAQSKLVVMASQAGGMDIEQVAAETPEKILRETIDPGVGLQPFQARRLGFGLGLQGDALKQGVQAILALYKAYSGTDCSLAEINPLVVTGSGDIVALDAKMNFDDNALYRQKDILALRDTDEEAPLEVEASEFDLNYIKLDGEVGCMVNGAGLAMATMDIVKYAGSSPANFLDVGGGTNVERVQNAFRILMSDPDVKAVLINIFGGIVRCDRVAEGVVQALKNLEVDVPIVVRLQGTNAEEGARILEASDLEFRVARELKEAAEAVVAAVKEAA
jgi:succinyl-CoA synthetase beta subunit